MKRRIYVASSWRNPHYPEVVRALRDAGHDVYDFRENAFRWSELGLGETCGPGALARGLDDPRAREHFKLDSTAMESADTCVLVLPAGRSAHLEAGWFAGRDRSLVGFTTTVLVYAPGVDITPELMYLLAGEPSDWLVTDLAYLVHLLEHR